MDASKEAYSIFEDPWQGYSCNAEYSVNVGEGGEQEKSKDEAGDWDMRIGRLHHNIHRIVLGLLRRLTRPQEGCQLSEVEVHQAVLESVAAIRRTQNTRKLRANEANISRVLLGLREKGLDPVQVVEAVLRELQLLPQIDSYDVASSRKIRRYFEVFVLRAAANLCFLAERRGRLSEAELKLPWRKAFEPRTIEI